MSKEEEASESNPSTRESSEASEAQPTTGPSKSSKKPTKVAKPRLTLFQKNFNHKDAENKRRSAIRERFSELSHMVPGALGHERSEQVMLGKTAGFLKEMLMEQRRLEAMADDRGIQLDEAGRLRDDDFGGPLWRPKNMDQYEASKKKKCAPAGPNANQGGKGNE
ncbi:uncharacterized protein Z518_02244 [Rhinocladiella mackenziei CBS 650.93]|uniref:Rhinocladiella mackenziei CBS 650.93 unplaced genomic scaffold supercont1.2, whole genome shotgun sequence n=1 Tax=Rhinocladiella mackenziei CBS 650.93 TaxID=1442369 RepID=A0A0D2IWC7_9EURO|nr:uncharacterized protein Z518_02244 [Rhinocladiella mackenziei CBS 650.93]KIX07591.1 hypothetical protein Z518_02244 [Rhinocladiella mackenziei CBS 650.93]